MSDFSRVAPVDPPTPQEVQLAQMQQVIAMRGAATFGMLVDGLGYMLDQAKQGDRGARQALLQLRGALREMERLLGVWLPGDPT